MNSYIVLLRAINVGGTAALPMATLKDLLRALGFQDPHSLLNTGNVVVRANATRPEVLEGRIERELSSRLGIRTDVFVRTVEEWRAVLGSNPFPAEAEKDPAHLLVTALKTAPTEESWASLRAAIPGRERIHGSGRHAFLVYPDGIGRSKLTMPLIERQLGTRGTSRNWNTAQKLVQLASE